MFRKVVIHALVADVLALSNVSSATDRGAFLGVPIAGDISANDTVGTELFKAVMASDPAISEHISMEVPYNNAWEEFITFPERRPRITNVVLATVKTWLADLVVQMLDADKTSFDSRRSVAFAMFGFVYVGIVQWFLYVSVLTSVCPHAIGFANEPLAMKSRDSRGIRELFFQMVLDNCCFAAFVYFPAFYLIKEWVNSSGSIQQVVPNAFRKYLVNCRQDNFASCCMWVPMDLVIFACPIFMRLPLDHSVSFLWTMVLSYMRGSARSLEPNKAGPSK